MYFRSHRIVWLPLALNMFIVAWGGNEFTPLLVHYRLEGAFSDFIVDSMLVAYALGVAVGLLGAGQVTDHVGRKPIMLPTPFLAVVGSVLISAGDNTPWLMATGRLCSGVAVGMAMTAGGAWMKELSTARFEHNPAPTAGAKRASMALTAGFSLGPAVSGTLAQWAPFPTHLAYVTHIIATLLLAPMLLTVPETRQPAHLPTLRDVCADFPIRGCLRPHFLWVVAPTAPWVFGACFVAAAILPAQLQSSVSVPVALSALMTMSTLGIGFGVQQLGSRLIGNYSGRGPIIGMSCAVLGMCAAVQTVSTHSLLWTVASCTLLGLTYGVIVFTGLSFVQAMAEPRELATMTGVFYCLTYVGMLFPAALTKLGNFFTFQQMLGCGVVVAVVTLVVCGSWAQRHSGELSK